MICFVALRPPVCERRHGVVRRHVPSAGSGGVSESLGDVQLFESNTSRWERTTEHPCAMKQCLCVLYSTCKLPLLNTKNPWIHMLLDVNFQTLLDAGHFVLS